MLQKKPEKGMYLAFFGLMVNRQWFEEPSVSLVVHVSPEGRSSEVAGARLARRTNVQWSIVQSSMVNRPITYQHNAHR